MPPSTPSLFPATPSVTETITAHCDGGARGNPGPAGYGVEITDAQGNVIAELSEFLGIRTNNYAEYSGLLASLQYALDHGHKSLRVISDSELMVKQIQGKYKVNSPDLKPLWGEAKSRIARLDRFEIAHALRHKNKDADRLANEAMDRGMKRGPEANDRGTKRGPDPNGPGMQRNTPAESQPTISSPDPRLSSKAGVQSLPLRAIPYPDKSTAPPPPANLDPGPQLSSPRTQTPAPPEPSPATPAMLRGFARDGVIHILGPHTLPNGTFVKIIPE